MVLMITPLGARERTAGLLEVRLITPVSSRTSKPGKQITAVVIAPFHVGDRVIPPGTIARGCIRSAKRVGLGLVRETAKLALDFTELELASGTRVPLKSRLAEVDNARERVDGNGVIRGIRATASLSHRVGYRFFNLALANPAGFVPVLLLQTCIFHFPDPEIEYPAGTDLKLELLQPVPADAGVSEAPTPQLDSAALEDLDAAVQESPFWTVSTTGKHAVDVVNLMFVGSRESIERAFDAAGWTAPRDISAAARLSVMRAVAELRALPDAPMRTLLLTGEAPAMSRQRSLNTTAKRHHLRIWKSGRESRGREIWVSAATHDIDVTISLKHGLVTHAIALEIDLEREKIVNDLRLTGCVDAVQFVDRPEATRLQGGVDRKGIQTDRRVAALVLNECQAPVMAHDPTEQSPAPSRMTRVVRTITLSARNYFLRCNWPYRIAETGYTGIRTTVIWRRNRSERRARLAAANP